MSIEDGKIKWGSLAFRETSHHLAKLAVDPKNQITPPKAPTLIGFPDKPPKRKWKSRLASKLNNSRH